MVSPDSITEFLKQHHLGVVGVTPERWRYANRVFRDLKAKGYHLYPVNPNFQLIEEQASYPDIISLKEKIGGIVIITSPEITELLVKDAAKAGIANIWMQPGAESATAVDFCRSHGINAIFGECVMLHSDPLDCDG